MTRLPSVLLSNNRRIQHLPDNFRYPCEATRSALMTCPVGLVPFDELRRPVVEILPDENR